MPPAPDHPLAVLCSGGLDSAVLLAEAARSHPAVYPVYVRTGLHWEAAEQDHLGRFLAALAAPAVRPVVVLDQPAADLYGPHWSVTGRDVPDADTPDEAVYLPGRNALLLLKPLLWCHMHRVPELALAPLGANPFPDATPAFFNAYAASIGRAVGADPVRVTTPYAELSKADVLRRGAGLPLGETLSCLRPVGGRHCGVCNKCAERRAGFAAAGVVDPTRYAS